MGLFKHRQPVVLPMLPFKKFTKERPQTWRDVILAGIVDQLKQMKIITDREIVLSGCPEEDAKRLAIVLNSKVGTLINQLKCTEVPDEKLDLLSSIVILNYSWAIVCGAYDISIRTQGEQSKRNP